MVVERIAGNRYQGLSTDTKPTTNILTNATFEETNTKKWFQWSGSQWEGIDGSHAFDYRVFIDTTDSNKIKARDGHGRIFSSHATDADVVMNAVINDLSAGSTIGGSQGGLNPFRNMWTGGKYGSIFVGPGTFNTASSIIYKANLLIHGSGPWATKFRLQANRPNNSTSNVFKSSQWDVNAFSSPVNPGIQHGDTGVRLQHFTIDGNRANNKTVTNTATTFLQSGIETVKTSYGFGIAHYGAGFYLQDISVMACRGAGIVFQYIDTNFGDTGKPIDSDIFGVPPDREGYAPTAWSAVMENITASGNGQQGVLIRGALPRINDIICAGNGEQAIDAQSCDFMSGRAGWISTGILFLNGQNHINEDPAVWNPRCNEVRITGNQWTLSNLWIEGPEGPGDCLMLGNGIAAQPERGTGYQLDGSLNYLKMSNVMIDNAINSAIHMAKWCYRDKVQAFIKPAVEAGRSFAVSDATRSQGVTCLGRFGNYLDIYIRDLPSPADTTNTHSALIMGNASNVATHNNVKLTTNACQYILKWGHASNTGNNIQVQLAANSDFAPTVAVLEPSSAAVNYATNSIDILASGTNTIGLRSRNGGLFTANGAATTYNIPHGLYGTPNVVDVTANTLQAKGFDFVTANATNIVVTYPAATPSGTNVVKLWWNARVNLQ